MTPGALYDLVQFARTHDAKIKAVVLARPDYDALRQRFWEVVSAEPMPSTDSGRFQAMGVEIVREDVA